jgi:peptidyl-prolyl cis-trans isomerase D
VLESIFKRFRGFVLVLMVMSLSAIFVLQFGGPQAQGCSQGAGQGYAAEIYGQKITVNQFRAAYALSGGDNVPPEMAEQYKMEEMVLHGLVERALLAREAKRLGYSAHPDDVMHKVAEDGLVHVSMSVNAGPFLPPSGPRRYDFKDSKGAFSKDNLKRFIQYRLRRSVEEFANEQSEETLAQNARDSVAAMVTVSPEEVWAAHVREKETVTLKYARFSPTYYRETLKPTAADVDAFMQANKAAVDAEYDREKHRYTALEKQVWARHILIKTDSAADDATKAAAKAQAEKLLARAKAGEDFVTLAKTYSEDPGSAKKGGDLGYNPKGRMVTPFDDAQFALKPGELSGVVESTFGYHIIKVEGVREGDVPVDEAKRELAEKLYLDGKASEMAKAAALATLEALKAGKSADELNATLALPPGAAAPAAGATPAEPDPLAPQLRDTRPFGRTDAPIAGPFDGSPLVRAAFEMTDDKPLADAPMQLGDEWVVYRLQERVRVERKDVAETDLARVREGLLAQKRRDAVTDYVRQLLKTASDDKAVFVDVGALRTSLPES